MTSVGIKYTDLNSLPTFQDASVSRLQSLYADISRQKHSNPPSYHSTVRWWRQTIQSVMLKSLLPRSSDHLVLHASPAVADSFRYEGVGKPLCLATVIVELSEAKAYITFHQFLNSTQSVYDPGWLPLRIANFVVGKPLWWALQQLNIVSYDEGGHQSDLEKWKKVTGDYVVIDLLEVACQAITTYQRSKGPIALIDRLYTLESFRKEFAAIALPEVVLSDLDIRVLLKYLHRDRKVVVMEKEIIKFIEQDTYEPQDITAVDHGLLELKTAVQNLQTQVENIQEKISERTKKASIALSQKRHEVALCNLRTRKQLEDLLAKRIHALENLESTLLSVERAAGDVEIMKTYESSTITLRTILAHPSLQHEKIQETMDAMNSASRDAQDIDEIIQLHSNVDDQIVTEQELEDELQALIEEMNRAKSEVKDTFEVKTQQREPDTTQPVVLPDPVGNNVHDTDGHSVEHKRTKLSEADAI